jgi:hypothetical protein
LEGAIGIPIIACALARHDFTEGAVSSTHNATRTLRWANLVLAMFATLAPLAHVLELPNKLGLDGPLWLAVQQNLYRGWGPLLGGPAEIGALATTLALMVVYREDRYARRLLAVAAAAYAIMLISFFTLNNPVNVAVSGWTPTTLPFNWPNYRLRWEAGHALAALMSVIGLLALARAHLIAIRRSRPAGP